MPATPTPYEQASDTLDCLIRKLELELRQAAADGDIFTCDRRHDQIDKVETVQALLAGERDA